MRQQIYLSNTFSRKVFPDNSSGEFTNVLNVPIPPRHSISVSEVYYLPKNWLNVRETNNEIIMIFSGIGRSDNHTIVDDWSKTYKISCKVPPGLYTDIFVL